MTFSAVAPRRREEVDRYRPRLSKWRGVVQGRCHKTELRNGVCRVSRSRTQYRPPVYPVRRLPCRISVGWGGGRKRRSSTFYATSRPAPGRGPVTMTTGISIPRDRKTRDSCLIPTDRSTHPDRCRFVSLAAAPNPGALIPAAKVVHDFFVFLRRSEGKCASDMFRAGKREEAQCPRRRGVGVRRGGRINAECALS